MTNFMIGNFVTGTSANENPKTGRALSYVESINGDGTLNLKVVATIYSSEERGGITGDGFFTNRDPELYVKTTIHNYVTVVYGLDNVHFMDWFEEFAIMEKYDEFKEGALIIGNSENWYTCTNSENLCIIDTVYSTPRYGDDMEVTVLTNQTGNFGVEKCAFDLISIKEYFERFPDARLNREYKNRIWGGYYLTKIVTTTNEIMDIPNREYPVSDEITELHTDQTMKAYGMVKYGVMHDACKERVEETNVAKAGLRNIFSHHPNWDAKNMWIRNSVNWKRPVVPERITEFTDWFNEKITEIYAKKGHKECGMSYTEVEESLDKIISTIRFMNKLLQLNGLPTTQKSYKSVSLNGFYLDHYYEEEARLLKIKECFYEKCIYVDERYTYLNKEDGAFYFAVHGILINLKKWILRDGHLLTEERAEQINNLFKDCHKPNGKRLIRTNAGMKVSRFMALLGRLSGVDRIVEEQTREWEVEGANHERIAHSRTTDIGWNGRFAKFADGINPYTIRRHTIISTHPVDYIFASNGTNWTSCHFICQEPLTYSGSYESLYGGGADGLMRDNSTVVMYLIDENYNGTDFMFVPKERRCLFHIGSDKIVQGRVYPDGRDGGDLGASEQMRIIMQTTLAECLGVPNLWKVEYGYDANYSYCVTEGNHYEDYFHYDDTTISFLKGNNADYVINPTPIKIGQKAMCPVCGVKHDNAKWVYCVNHRKYYNKRDCDNAKYMVKCIRGSEYNYTCNTCGGFIFKDDAICDKDTGLYYCCKECAEQNGVHYCFNTENYHSKHIYFDDYEHDYFYDRLNIRIEVEGKTFWYPRSAEEAGYIYCDDIREWRLKENAVYCTSCHRWVAKENYIEEEGKCRQCDLFDSVFE